MSYFKRLFLGESVKTSGKASFKSLRESEPTPEEPTEDELKGLWLLNETVDVSSIRDMRWDINFTSNGESNSSFECYFDGASSESWAIFYSNLLPIWSGDVGDVVITPINNSYRYLNISSTLVEVTDGATLLAWLKANGTKYFVSGVWVFNDTISYSGNNQEVNFTSAGDNFTSMVYTVDHLQYGRESGYIYAYKFSNIDTGEGVWVYSYRKTVDFGSTPQEVSREYAEWLPINAKRKVISFTIHSQGDHGEWVESYQAYEGMTWAEWVNSPFNTSGYVINLNNDKPTNFENSMTTVQNVTSLSVIQDNVTYNASNTGDVV